MQALIAHIGIWTDRLEELSAFYTEYFGGERLAPYINELKRFESCTIRFAGGCRLELMRQPERQGASCPPRIGLAHFALALEDEHAVRELTERLRRDGYRIVSEPRTTGDGCYESVAADPDGNLVEITC